MAQTPDPSAGRLPTFVIIGAQKSATRWLRVNLGEHPDVWTSDTEVSFFNDARRARELGIGWYRRQFADAGDHAHVGEATPGYMMWRHGPAAVADRLREAIPGARLFAVLRDPVERAASAVRHHIKHERLPPGTDLRTAVERIAPEEDRLGIISGSWYAESLAPFAERFGDALAILRYDDVRDDPKGVYSRALEHIGAAPGFVPDELATVRYGNADATSESGPAEVEGARPERSGVDPDLRVELYDRWFRDDVERLAEMTGLDLSEWDPRSGVSSAQSSPDQATGTP